VFNKHDNTGFHSRIKGIDQKTLVYGERTLMTEFRLKKHHQVPHHSHACEQTGYMIAGEMILTIGSNPYRCLPGDSWCIPMNMEHQAEVIEDSVVIEVFSPVRKDYLPERKESR
jgi:quercetin dioxygenase-like cupin family protein